ncbi:sn-glycerol-3-phosphate-binding periplasmic protein UgpB [Clostridium pasteurianum DSM 525 = ATCC 6013]|uniref:sn-glycerol-3-phosphate-binding periplasmic protein UgpB n=1 Tax=Clostridium pasteurianum DSM 525 = ATCC 6013 TaxID=1262449 RepID=A0A0H3JB31_CLOPA|nr:ABC transporter substrate-binding protein [Clostridium pasteurianum]AJA49035.1 sn-glycerol-3-phosphate-binding periplasmic protein UgpB [Clostridium pasteurianum DSM 525 = ATCC 6013]AJA53023.1 sn-glycerol-3-phosphate-binding periplasmic protein UgpB [Clostridium pasteurianum DSM 525 = ATCC 6013]AOZ76240.1 ABC transporter substrate-binding protein [Clostridium pasteurianum DSM 525 = ATCC 6013]AOZ80036.1 ABC transporter substrate-binding protein [Clostridium pasteurianum]ELP60331.1 ABC transp
MKKKLKVIIASALLGMTLAGCTTPQANASSGSNNGKTEIVLWHAMGGKGGSVLKEVVDNFNNTTGKEKNIFVKAVHQGTYQDTDTKLKAVLQANNVKNMPDLVQSAALGVFTLKEYKDTLWIDDLEKKYPDFDLSNIEPNALAAASYKGRHLGMPFSNSTMLMYYNKDQYKEAGLDPEKPAATLDELADHVAKLTKKQGKEVVRYGMVHQLNFYAPMSWIGMQKGGSYLVDNENGRSATPTKVVFGENGTMKEVLTKWQKIYKTGGLDYTGTDASKRFAAGETSIFLGSTASLPSIVEGIGGKFQLGTAFLPKVHPEDNAGVATGGSSLYALNKHDENKEKAIVEFLKYMSSPETQFKWHTGTGYFPVNKKTYDLPEMQEHLKKNPLFKTAIDQLHQSSPKVQEMWMPSFQEFETFQTDTVTSMLDGEIDVDTAIKNVVEKGDELINNYRRANSK